MMGKKYISVIAYTAILSLVFLSGFSVSEAKSKNDKSERQETPSIFELIKESVVEPAASTEPTPEPSPEPTPQPTQQPAPAVNDPDEEESEDSTVDEDDDEENPTVQTPAAPVIVKPEPEAAAPVVTPSPVAQPNIEDEDDTEEAAPVTIIERIFGKKRAQKKAPAPKTEAPIVKKEEVKVIATPAATPALSTSTPATTTPATTTPIVAETKPEPPKTLAETATAINEQVKSWSEGYRLDPLAWAVNYFAPEDYYMITDNLSTPLSLGLLALSTILGISGFVLLQRPKQYGAPIPNNALQAQGKVMVKFLIWPSIIISILLTLLLNLIL